MEGLVDSNDGGRVVICKDWGGEGPYERFSGMVADVVFRIRDGKGGEGERKRSG